MSGNRCAATMPRSPDTTSSRSSPSMKSMPRRTPRSATATSSPSSRPSREAEDVGYLTDSVIDTAALTRRVMRPSDGACIVFEGVVRNHHDGHAGDSIFYDAYRPMAEKEIDKVIRGVRE